MATYPRRSSYGIFVRFRRSRLALRRGITRLEDAISIAEQLRASRFHDRGDIFVIKEPEGILVELAPEVGAAGESAPVAPAGSAPAPPPVPGFLDGATPGSAPPSPPLPAVTMGGASPNPPPAAVTMGGDPPSPPLTAPPLPMGGDLPPRASEPPPPQAGGDAPDRRTRPPSSSHPPEPLDLRRLRGLVAEADRVRAAVGRARAAQTRFELAYSAAEHALHVRGAIPADLRRNQERLGALRVSAARSLASFERVAALVERRLERAWAEATGHAAPPR